MVIEKKELLTFFEWLLPTDQGPGGLLTFLVVSVVLLLLGLVVSYVFCAVRRGPAEGFFAVARGVYTGVVDFANTSPRRVFAMASLAIKEAIRRRVLIAFAVFVVVLLFAGWFLDVQSDHPARIYISFVLTASTYLVLVLALFLSAFSLPNDIKNRTIYTIVTKPVRASEIVMGRIIGFVVIGTMLLTMMGVVSYFFVTRGLSHEHAVILDSRQVQGEGKNQIEVWETTFNSHHRHIITRDSAGAAYVDSQMGHTHAVTDNGGELVLGPPQGQLQAKVPIYGKLRFLDRAGKEAREGINVGNEWTYRSYIGGGSQAATWWTFNNVTPERFPNGLPIELTLSVFRTHKGDIERGVLGELYLKNPDKNITSESDFFTSVEYGTDQKLIPRTLNIVDRDTGLTKKNGDLFTDLVSQDGRLEVWVKCAEPGQYFGMAQPDVYLRSAERTFAFNFAKGYVSIWLQMVLVVAFGVMFSTFLSGSVTMLATLASLVLGYFASFVVKVATGEVLGGGPMESFYRLFSQKNVSTELDPSASASAMENIDLVMMQTMQSVVYVLPSYRDFGTSHFVAYGFNINGDLLATHIATTLSYGLAVTIIAYFALKSRELAA